MSITRLQQARQMYATGQRVGRVAFQGGGRDRDYQQRGTSKSNYSAQTKGHSHPGIASQYSAPAPAPAPKSTNPNYSGGNANTGTVIGGNIQPDPGFQNALREQQIRQNTITDQANPNYGQFFGSSVPTYQPPTLGQRIGQGVRDAASGVGDFARSGGLLGVAARGLGSFFGGIGLKSNLARRKDFISKYNTSVPPSERIYMPDDDITSAEGLSSLKELGYKTISDMPTGPQNDDNNVIPLWAQLGYPSYEAWASAQNIPGEDTIDDTETEDFVWRFAGNQPEDVRERIQEEYKDYYTV